MTLPIWRQLICTYTTMIGRPISKVLLGDFPLYDAFISWEIRPCIKAHGVLGLHISDYGIWSRRCTWLDLSGRFYRLRGPFNMAGSGGQGFRFPEDGSYSFGSWPEIMGWNKVSQGCPLRGCTHFLSLFLLYPSSPHACAGVLVSELYTITTLTPWS